MPRLAKRAVSIVCAVGASFLGAAEGSPYNTAEIKPGEADYPSQKVTPRQIVQLVLTVPSRFSIVGDAVYTAASPGGTLASGTSCQREVAFAVTAPFVINVPVHMVRDGTVYRGTLVVDRYEPGRCDWQFRGLSLQLLSNGERNNPARSAQFSYSLHESLPIAQHADYWCSEKDGCSNLGLLLSNGRVGSAFVASIPEGRRGTGDAILVGPRTTSLTIDFHDLDAVDPQKRMAGGADPEAYKKTPEYKALQCFQKANVEYVQTHRPLPDTATQTAAMAAMRQKCRAEVGLPPQ